MAPHPVKHETRTERAGWLSAGLVLAASIFAAVALFAPRSVTPNRLPPLLLDRDAAEAAMAQDRERAKHAPSGRWVSDLRELHARIGRGAHEDTHSASEVRGVYVQAERRARAVKRTHGEEGLWALRAQDVTRLDQALAHEMPERKRVELLGKLEEQLLRYHVRSQDGALRAPKLVAWTMFKARWNMLCGLAATAGFEPIEVQAYEGWLALHGVGAPRSARFAAAQRYERAGGWRGAEAVAVWAMRMGAKAVANAALERAAQPHRSVRLRNYAIALAELPQ